MRLSLLPVAVQELISPFMHNYVTLQLQKMSRRTQWAQIVSRNDLKAFTVINQPSRKCYRDLTILQWLCRLQVNYITAMQYLLLSHTATTVVERPTRNTQQTCGYVTMAKLIVPTFTVHLWLQNIITQCTKHYVKSAVHTDWHTKSNIQPTRLTSDCDQSTLMTCWPSVSK